MKIVIDTPRRVSARLRGDAPAVIPLATDDSSETDTPTINYVVGVLLLNCHLLLC
jgi:hypothetical protein